MVASLGADLQPAMKRTRQAVAPACDQAFLALRLGGGDAGKGDFTRTPGIGGCLKSWNGPLGAVHAVHRDRECAASRCIPTRID